MSSRKPIIGVPADRRLLGSHWFHCVGEKYLAAIRDSAGATPIIVPSFGDHDDRLAILARCDGILLTGSPSNVEPHRYEGADSLPGTWHDPHRDETTLSLIPEIVGAGMPLLAICRGFQELNVAYGGTLHQRVQELPGYQDHRENGDAPLDEQYAPAHELRLLEGGFLSQLIGTTTIQVNSLHQQGIDRLGDGLTAEGFAPDGLIEAVRVTQAARFAVALQWHPEWKSTENAFSRVLFAAFGDAARDYARSRGEAHHSTGAT
jgi:putative glutamine amidotransferase